MTPSLISRLRGHTLGPPPIWLMRQAGRYLPEYRKMRASLGSFMDLCLTPALASEVTLQPIRRFGLDAAVIFSDILMIPYALGQSLVFDDAPRLGPFSGDITPPVDWQDRLAPVYQALTLTRQSLSPEVALIGFAGGPWTLACYMIDGHGQGGFAKIRALARSDPARIDAVLNDLVPVIARHLINQAKAGAQVLQIFDSWAGLLAHTDRARWLEAPTAAIMQRIRAEVDVPVIGFARGLGFDAIAFAKAAGVDALTLDSTVDLTRARQATILPFQGNVDPVHLLIGGAALDRQVDHLCQIARDHPLVINLSHGIWPQTPLEHVARLIDRVRMKSWS